MSYASHGFASLSRNINGRRPLTNDELFKLAPSIFAADRHESRSERYTYIPTSEIVDGMRANGFDPVFCQQGRSRIEGKEAYTKHLVRFRPTDAVVTAKRIGGLYPEVCVVNSHDGTSAYKVMAGVLRLVCLNGNVVSDGETTNISIPHKGDILGQVIEGSFEVIQDSRLAIEHADHWAGINLNPDEQLVLAEAAHVIRFGDAEGNVETPIRPAQLLHARRTEDQGSDLYRVGQRIQENMIRGGLSAYSRDANNRPRLTTSREVKSIDGDIKMNKALWALTAHMARLKEAA